MNASPRILIVEDDAVLVIDLQSMLMQMGYEVAGMAATGKQAVELAFAQKPDAILMDINLRGKMTGIEAAEKIHEQQDTPVIYLTAFTDETLIQQAKNTDAYAYLAKPVRERELRASLEMSLYKHSTEQRLQHLNQVLRAVRDVNQLITREHDPKRLVDEACQIILHTRGYQYVWIGQSEGDILKPLSHAGDDQGLIQKIRATATPEQGRRLPGTEVSRTGQVVVCHDTLNDERYAPWQHEIEKTRFKSTVAIPMLHAGNLFGVLIVYADQTNMFDAEEIDLLLELAGDIAFGLKAIAEEFERKRAEAAQHESEARFRAIVENSHDGIILMGPDRRPKYVSPSYTRINGYSPEEWIGAYGPDFIHPDDRAFIANIFSQVLQNPEKIFSLEYRLRHKKGYWFWVETTVTNLLNDPHIQAIVLNSRDITERKRAEEELRASETRFHALSAEALVGVYIIKNGVLTYVNSAMAKMFGYDPEALTGASPLVLVHPDDHALVSENIRRRMDGEIKSSQYEFRGRHKNGETRYMEVMGVRVDINDQPAVIGNMLDITERKQADAALQESEAQYRGLFEHMHSGFILMEVIYHQDGKPVDHRLLQANAEFEAQTGLKREEEIGRAGAELSFKWPPEVAQRYYDIAANGGAMHLERFNESLQRHYDVRVFSPCKGQWAMLFNDITERKRAEEALRQKNQYLIALQNTTLELVSQLDLNTLLENIVKRACALIGTSAGLLDLVDPETNQLIPQIGVGALEESLHLPVQPGEGLVGTVWQTGEALVIPDYDQWAKRLGRFNQGVLGSVAGVPLLSGAHVLGVLAVGSKYGTTHPFDPATIENLNQFARLAIVAVQNARLFSNLQDELEERKRAEEQLRESELRFRTIIENALIGISIGRNGKLLYANPVYMRMHGFTNADEVIGLPTVERVAPHQREITLERAIQRAQGIFTETPYELIGLRQDGTEFPMLASVSRVKLADGFANVGFFQDITARKQAEEALQISEQTARQTAEQLRMVNQIGVSILANLDLEQRLQTLHEQCKQIGDTDTFYVALYDETTGMLNFPFNYKDGERRALPPRNVREIPGLSGYIIKNRQTLYLPDQSDPSIEITSIRQPGAPTRAFVGVPLMVNERVIGILSMQSHAVNAYNPEQIHTLELLAIQVAIAIHNSQLYAQVQHSQEQLQAIVQTANDAIITMDARQNIVFWNAAAEHIFGFSAEEMVGNPIERIIPDRFRQQNRQAIERVFLGGERRLAGRTIEVSGLNHAGQEFPIEMSLAEWKTQDGHFVTAIIRNIAERKQAEDQIKKSLAEKETLLRELHHRTRNNMGVIISLLELQSNYFDDERLKKEFEVAQNRIHSMALVHKKLYENKDLSMINLKGYISELVADLLYHSSVSPDQVSIIFEMEDVFVLIDTVTPCGLILNELVSNSLKYAFPGGRTGELRVRLCQLKSGEVQLGVTDNGIGLPSGFNPKRDGLMGLQTIFMLAKHQLQAQISFSGEQGVSCQIHFMDNLYKPRV